MKSQITPFLLSLSLVLNLTVTGCLSGEKKKIDKSDEKNQIHSDKKSKNKDDKKNIKSASEFNSKIQSDEPAFCSELLDNSNEMNSKYREVTFNNQSSFLNGLAVGHSMGNSSRDLEKGNAVFSKYAEQCSASGAPTDNNTDLAHSAAGSAEYILAATGHKKNSMKSKKPENRDISIVDKCTFYFNKGSKNASQKFNWYPVDRPNSKGDNVDEYLQFFGGANSKFSGFDLEKQKLAFSNAPKTEYKKGEWDPNLLYACVAAGQVTMGCDGMKHRGPTFIGMLMSYAGCKPKTVETVIRQRWQYHFRGNGKIDASKSLRLPYFQAAYDLGKSEKHKTQSVQVTKFFEGNPFDRNLLAKNEIPSCSIPLKRFEGSLAAEKGLEESFRNLSAEKYINPSNEQPLEENSDEEEITEASKSD